MLSYQNKQLYCLYFNNTHIVSTKHRNLNFMISKSIGQYIILNKTYS